MIKHRMSTISHHDFSLTTAAVFFKTNFLSNNQHPLIFFTFYVSMLTQVKEEMLTLCEGPVYDRQSSLSADFLPSQT